MIKLWKWIQHKRAERIRAYCKRQIIFDEAELVFSGQKTNEESFAFRQRFYKRLDDMSDEEIIRL
jgi:hypothetical protein